MKSINIGQNLQKMAVLLCNIYFAIACGPSDKELLYQKNMQVATLLRNCGYNVVEFSRKEEPFANYAYWKVEGKGIEAFISQKDASTIVYFGQYTLKAGDNLHSVISKGIGGSPNRAIVSAVEDLNNIEEYVYPGTVYKVPLRSAYARNVDNELAIADCVLP